MPRKKLVSLTFAGLLILSAAGTRALAQDGSQIMVRRDGDGGNQVLHFTLPDLEQLRTPDFTRKDLPIFNDRLVLSEPQSAAIGRLIDSYVEAFRALTKDLAVTAGAGAEYLPEGEGDAPQRGGARAAIGLGGGAPMQAMDLSDLEGQLPPGSNIGITVGVDRGALGGGGGGGGDGGAPPAPQANVQVSVDSPEGEISPELMAKIQERANEMAANIVQRIQEQMNAAQQGGDGGAGGGARPDPGVGIMNIEEMQAKQAELEKKIEEFLKAKAKLRAGFVTDAQTNLAQEQIARWPELERALTRVRSLPRGRIAGESTDLEEVFTTLKIADSELESIAPQIEAYELALDSALKQRDAFLATSSKEIDQAIAENKPDRAVQIADRSSDLRVAVRSVNQNYMQEFAMALGGERGEAFKAAALRAFYPQVYQTTRGQKMFDAVAKMQGLDAALVASIADMRTVYDAELASVNDQIRQTIDREQPKDSQRGLKQLKQTMRGDGHGAAANLPGMQEDPVRAAMEKRADLDDRYLKNVAAMLPPDQAATLPHPRTQKGPIVIRSGGSQ